MKMLLENVQRRQGRGGVGGGGAASALRMAATPGPWAGAGTAWLDLARSGKLLRDGIATWSMARVFLDSGNSRASREQLNEAKTWIDAFAPFGEGRAELSRRNGQTVLALDLGLSGAGAPE